MSPPPVSHPATTALHVVPAAPYREGKTATWRGGLYNIVDPRPADINLNEMCEALARLERFNALSRSRWTVAQHTLLCLRIVRELDLVGDAGRGAEAYVALHDFHEAFIGDQTAPQQYAYDITLKKLYPSLPPDAFRHARETLAQRWDNAIYAAFRLPAPDTLIVATVRKVDRLALIFEAAMLFDRPQNLGITEAEVIVNRPDAARLMNDTGMSWPNQGAVAEKLAREIRRLV